MGTELNLKKHPCFNADAKGRFGRIHLPVAPRCNIQCNFCDRKYDCVNESRPGVTSSVLSPAQAVHYLRQMVSHDPRLSVVGIAGPGDPFANPDETLETLRRVRDAYPEMLLCAASNGLNAGPFIEDLADLDLTHLTITVNAVDAEIGAKVYAWVRDGKRIYRGKEAASLLWERQKEAIALASKCGLTIKINTILMPGVNDHHVETVAKTVGDLGASLFNCMPVCSVKGTVFEDIPEPSASQLKEIRGVCEGYLPQMLHCTRCRADAVGCLGEKISTFALKCLRETAAGPLNPQQDRPYVAVASMEGALVNQHLGKATDLWIYQNDNGRYTLVETRKTPAPGEPQRWEKLAEMLGDCRTVLASAAGQKPEAVLAKAGIKVACIEGLITQALEYIYHGKDLGQMMPVRSCGGCSKNATPCG